MAKLILKITKDLGPSEFSIPMNSVYGQERWQEKVKAKKKRKQNYLEYSTKGIQTKSIEEQFLNSRQQMTTDLRNCLMLMKHFLF